MYDRFPHELKFIAFGRGKCIPLTPENQNVDLPGEISNTGRIVVNKYIDKIDKRETILQAEKEYLNRQILDRNFKSVDRKKKSRLYSLGGNEPQRKGYRGRLDRLKTVGTFDLGTEMCVLTEVARNLNKQIMSGEMGLIPPFIYSDQGLKTISVTSSASLSVHNSRRTTPLTRKKELGEGSHLETQFLNRSPSHETKSNIEFKTQHSADDCLQRTTWAAVNETKSRSLSTSSYLDKDKIDLSFPPCIKPTEGAQLVKCDDICEFNEHPSAKTSRSFNEKESEKIEEDISSYEIVDKSDETKGASYKNRKPMLRKSRRIIRTDSEILSEGIFEDRNEIILKSNAEFQVHVSPNFPHETKFAECGKKKTSVREQDRNSSAASSVYSRKDSSDFDDTCFRKMVEKSTDESSKNPSTDEIDAVFSDSTTDLERLEKEYKEIIKSNLQREYKSDGDTLDEIGKKRSDFGKWKNQSLEHEFELSNQELINITGYQTLSSHSNETSGDVKDISRICSPESCANGASSDSGVRKLDNKYSSYSKMRSRVYSSSRLGETPKEKERLLHITDDRTELKSPVPIELSEFSSRSSNLRPSVLDIKPEIQSKSPSEHGKTSLFDKPFGKFKKVNKLLKCKRFSTSTLYDRKKTEEAKVQNTGLHKGSNKESATKTGKKLEKRGAIHLSKLSLFSQKQGKCSLFSSKKLSMFSNSSRSTNELCSKSTSKAKLSEVSKSNTEINKSKISPSRLGSRKSSKSKKNNSSTCVYSEQCHSPLSEEFYNKTGSVRLSAMELYEKFCSEDFGGLYKHEHFKSDDRKDGSYLNQHEYRLEKKGLRVIGRYNKNALLFKQKSEPKFNFRPNTSSDYYQEEDEEYYYNRKDKENFEYYNEQDEYYGTFADEYGEEIEGDYYDDDDGDYYDDEVNVRETLGGPPYIVHPGTSACQIESIEETSLEAGNVPRDIDISKDGIDINAAGDSDVDEIYLMPEESKCSDYEKCGFENKQFTLEQSMIGRLVHKNISLDHLNAFDDYDRRKEEKVIKSVDDLQDQMHSDILTIYKICSKESVIRSTENTEKLKKHVPTTSKGDGATAPVLDYVKLTQSKSVLEASTIKDEFASMDRTESLELLSNSSGTVHTHSTLTEYAFDTVKNLNMDSCSTSKLSLSLKSEVFDDFTITPDDIKPIQNCDFEDFTLTPEGSLSEICQKTDVPQLTKSNESEKSDIAMDEECKNEDVGLVDKFLENERKTSAAGSKYSEDYLENKIEVEAIFDDNVASTSDEQYNTEITTSDFTIIDLYDDEEHTISLFTTELTKEFDRLFSKAEEFEQSSCSNVLEDIPSRSEIPSRYSMQQLEPYYIRDCSESPERKPSNDYKKLNEMNDNQASKSTGTKPRLKKNRSKSLNNLNKKTKCFPL